MFHHCAHHLGQESRVLLLEEVKSHAEAFYQETKLLSRQLDVVFVDSIVTKLISCKHLSDNRLACLLQRGINLAVESQIRLG